MRKVCKTCPRLLSNSDLLSGCVRCVECRKATETPMPALNPEPRDHGSWWIGADTRDEFNRRMREQFERMAGSLEARKLRPASLDELLLKHTKRGYVGGQS